MKFTNYINTNWLTIAFSMLFLSVSYAQDPGWEADYESVPFDNEYSATLATVQVWIDGVEQTGGQLAAFGEDGEISAWDGDGATFFPPGGTNIYELSVWSNSGGELMTFKYYDDQNDVVYESHQDVVVSLPEDTVELAYNKKGNQSFIYNNNCFGVQFHPELKSRIVNAHPLFQDFIGAAIKYNERK